MRLPLILLLLALGGTPAAADQVMLSGRFVQGGLVVGTTEPGAEVTLDGRAIRVAKDGLFVFGLSRDAKPQATLVVRLPNGKVETRALEVKPQTYRIQRIRGVAKRFVTVPKKFWPRIKADRKMVAAARTIFSGNRNFGETFRWPVTGRISGVFGSQRVFNGKPRRPHYGVDVAVPRGTPFRAPAGGIVVLTRHLYFAGKTVILDHGQGISSAFIHMDKILVKVGQTLKQGDVIGLVGNTGRTTGPHLHWAMTWHKVYLDPALVVPPMPPIAQPTTPKKTE